MARSRYQCEDCGHPHVVPAACGNRHCPQCQHRNARLWLERQLERQLPGHHFMLTFTVPEALRPFLRHHQRLGYGALFQASSQAIKTLVRDSRFVGGDQPGFLGVLHTLRPAASISPSHPLRSAGRCALVG